MEEWYLCFGSNFENQCDPVKIWLAPVGHSSKEIDWSLVLIYWVAYYLDVLTVATCLNPVACHPSCSRFT